MSYRWRIPLVLAVVGAVSLAALSVREPQPDTAAWRSAPPELQAVLWPAPRPVDGFRLVTHSGAPFGPEQLVGDWSFVFFGYLSCPDVCPMTLYNMKLFRDLLVADDPRAASHRFLFVSVDPEFDTPDRIGEYLSFYDEAFIGLGGEDAEVSSLTTAMAVMVHESETDSGTRMIDHTSSIMVIDPSGRAVASFPPPHDPVVMVDRFREMRRHLTSHQSHRFRL